MYYSEADSLTLADGLLFDTEPEPKCEYRSPQKTDGETWVKCRSTAVMWTDRGLRCELHGRD